MRLVRLADMSFISLSSSLPPAARNLWQQGSFAPSVAEAPVREDEWQDMFPPLMMMMIICTVILPSQHDPREGSKQTAGRAAPKIILCSIPSKWHQEVSIIRTKIIYGWKSVGNQDQKYASNQQKDPSREIIVTKSSLILCLQIYFLCSVFNSIQLFLSFVRWLIV